MDDPRSARAAVTDRLEAWLREAGVPLGLTGCAPGAVPPFGNLFGLPVLVDEALTGCEEIAFNAGSNAVSITMRCDDFVRLSGARTCRFVQAEGTAPP